MKKIITPLFPFMLCMLELFECANLTGGGGGSDVGNGIVTGSIYNQDGSPATQTKVQLVPSFFDPGIDSVSSYCIIDTTDMSGRFLFSLSSYGTYNIEATNLINGSKSLITELTVRLRDTLFLPPTTLQIPGRVTIYLPDSINTMSGYLYIEGTTIWIPLSQAQHLPEGGYIIVLDSVPVATLPPITYTGFDTTGHGTIAINDSLKILPDGTRVLDATTSWQQFTTENSILRVNTINDLILLSGDVRWFATAGGGVVRMNGDTWTVYDTTNSPMPSNDARKISSDNNGQIWVATPRGAAVLGMEPQETYTRDNSGLPSNSLTDIAIDRLGRKWFGTEDAGLVMFDGEVWVAFDTAFSPLPSNAITRISIERDSLNLATGRIWCATPRGAALFENGLWSIFTKSNSGIGADSISSVMTDRSGNVWFGYRGGVSRLTGNIWTVYDAGLVPKFTSAITTITRNGAGHLLFGTASGLVLFDGVTWREFTGERFALIDNAYINTVAVDPMENIWIGTANQGIIVFGQNRFAGSGQNKKGPNP